MATCYGCHVTTRDFLALLKLDFDHIERHGNATTTRFFALLDEVA